MKKTTIILLIIFCCVEISQAQLWRRDREEFVFSLGATNFLGDLGGADQIGTNGFRDLNFPSTRPIGSVAYRYRTGRQHYVKSWVAFGFLYGNDALTEEPLRNNRNLHFRSPLAEIGTQFEWSLTRQREGHRYKLKGVRGWRHINIEAYVFAGVSAFWFDPRAQGSDGVWYRLKPLQTEGQGMVETRKQYSNFQVAIPMGFGFKYGISSNVSIGLEYGIRKTFTDYIDDCSTTYFDNAEIVKQNGPLAGYFADPSKGTIPTQTLEGEQRGDPTDKDAYMFACLTLYYKIPKGRLALPKF